MEIEPAQGFDALRDSGEAKNPPKANPSPSAADKTVDSANSAAESALQPCIERAAEAVEVRPDAVEDAKRLLAAGKLDTPEAAQRAAENILRLGI